MDKLPLAVRAALVHSCIRYSVWIMYKQKTEMTHGFTAGSTGKYS